MCDKVFKENPSYSKEAITGMLQEAFELEDIIFIPTHPEDWTGHADGLVRFLDEQWVFVSDFDREVKYQEALYGALHRADLECMVLPYNPYGNGNLTSAQGIYVNYLRMNGLVVVPTFDMEEDNQVVDLFENLFIPWKSVLSIDCEGRVLSLNCNEVARYGGVLNCISWAVQE
jgi:agmatine deiminase